MPHFLTHPLDYNRKFFLKFTHDDQAGELQGYLGVHFHSSGKFEKHVCEQSLRIRVGEQELALKQNHNGVYSFTAPLTLPAEMQILLDGEVYGHYRITPQSIEGEITNQLTVFETRSIAEYRARPYSRTGKEHIILPVTDTHTHSSAQGSYSLLIQKHGETIHFPVRLLLEFGINLPDNAKPVDITRVRFPPLDKGKEIPLTEKGIALASLSPASLSRLQDLLAVPVDEIHYSFSKLELTCYQLRAPFKKFATLMLEEIVREGQHHGLKYIELSTSGIDLNFLQMVETLLPRLEEETGVRLRFLYPIPRHLPPEMIDDHIEQMKILAKSPYLVGADIIGYEANKTAEISHMLEGIFQWASKNDSDFIIGMHAGENAKNRENVKHFLALAEKYNIRVRVRHAIYGMDEETISIVERMAQRGLIILELNPDTNLALNNIDDLEPIRRMLNICVEKRIPFVLPSDGAALYQTDRRQIALTGLFAGLDAEGFTFMQETELAHMARQDAVFAVKSTACPPGHIATLQMPSPTYTPAVEAALEKQMEQDKQRLATVLTDQHIITDSMAIEAALQNRTPIIVLGDNGKKWDEIQDCHPIIQPCLSALATLDPEKFLFVTGRTKKHGIAVELGRALGGRFTYLGKIVQAEKLTDEIETACLTHLSALEGDLLSVAFQMTDFARNHKGIMVVIGGGGFTREIIKCASDYGVPLLLMDGPPGASTDKAKIMQVASFRNADELLRGLRTLFPDISTVDHSTTSKTTLAKLRTAGRREII